MSLTKKELAFLRSARLAHLATADKTGQPHVVPICFVFDGKYFYSPIDDKPKRTTNLKRLKNIRDNPQVALIIDHYEEDWRKLRYLLVLGRARIFLRGHKHRAAVKRLRAKYGQYREMAIDEKPLIAIRINKALAWGDY